MTVAAFTLGCKVNQYDTDSILKDFCNLGFTICNFTDFADIYMINTCTVTNASDKKSRQMISRAHKQNPNAFVVAYGCYAKVDAESLQNIPGVSLVLGPQDKHNVAKIVADHFNVKATAVQSTVPTKRTRAYLKIQDGCDRFCSYCIVPYARGAVVSRSMAELIKEANDIVSSGCKEIVLTGIQIAAYGDNSGRDLIELMKRICDIDGVKRLRLSSLEPNIIDEEFLQAASKLPKLCDHFHLPLQSGCDNTLKRMNRRYSTAQYAKAVEDVRLYFPNATITTDVIVGFPGETDKEFSETLTFVEETGFFSIHVFPYSPKKGTRAAGFPNQIDNEIKEQRSKVLRSLSEKMNKAIYSQYIGKTLPVLFESQTNGIWEGRTTQYITVLTTSCEDLSNKIIPIEIDEEDSNEQ